MATPNQIIIDSPNNNVDIQTNNNQLTIISEVCNTEVNVTQPVVNTIQVATPGPQGPQGIQGIQGTQGTQGIQGVQGTQGTQGIQGVQGTQGTQGTQGIQGVQGTQGTQGIQGVQGTQGTQGIQGVQGTQGTQGTQGIQGVQGTQGTQGIQGIQGDTGVSNQISTGSITASVDIGTNTFRVQSGSSTYFYISSSGNIGIGTLTPTNTLQVVGGITATSITASIISASSGITGSLFGTSSWAVNALTASFLSGAFLQNGNSFGTTAVLGTNDTQNLQFETSGSVRMTISSSGDVGIGTTSPSVRLHLSQSSGIFQRVDINNANADGVNATQQYYTNTGATPDLFGATSFRLQGGTTDAFKQFQVYIANLTSPRFIINGSGNVGINTTSPNARLHISGANSDVLLIASSSAAPSALFVSGSGNVGIGTSTPAYRLDVSGSLNVNSGTTGQSSLSTGLIVNNDAGSSALYDFEVKTQLYDAIYVSSSNNSVTLMSNANGKIGFFGSTPTTQSNGWGATNVQVTKSFDADTITLAQLADVVGTLIIELKTKGLLG